MGVSHLTRFGLLACLLTVALGNHLLGEPCDLLECKAGRECRLKSDGTPECVCVSLCSSHAHHICGSNNKSYINHCHMHREACLTKKHLAVKHKGYCTKDAEQKDIQENRNADRKAVACFKKERDQLRSQIISWLQNQLKLPEVSQWTTSYADLVWAEFFACDLNKDNHLDATEFLDCVKDNVTFTKYIGTGEPNELLRALCIDAIMNIADGDDDWKLNSTEFQNCADPSYKAQDKKCFLEEKSYVDGDEITTNCSHCVCACGSWVCTNTYCDPDKNNKQP